MNWLAACPGHGCPLLLGGFKSCVCRVRVEAEVGASRRTCERVLSFALRRAGELIDDAFARLPMPAAGALSNKGGDALCTSVHHRPGLSSRWCDAPIGRFDACWAAMTTKALQHVLQASEDSITKAMCVNLAAIHATRSDGITECSAHARKIIGHDTDKEGGGSGACWWEEAAGRRSISRGGAIEEGASGRRGCHASSLRSLGGSSSGRRKRMKGREERMVVAAAAAALVRAFVLKRRGSRRREGPGSISDRVGSVDGLAGLTRYVSLPRPKKQQAPPPEEPHHQQQLQEEAPPPPLPSTCHTVALPPEEAAQVSGHATHDPRCTSHQTVRVPCYPTVPPPLIRRSAAHTPTPNGCMYR